MMTVTDAAVPGGPLDLLLRETIIPHAEELAVIQDRGDIAVVVHTAPDAVAADSLRVLGWNGETVFGINRTRARKYVAPADAVTARWVERRDPDELRMLIIWGQTHSTLLVNFRAGGGYSIEPGSLDSERASAFYGMGKTAAYGWPPIGES
jgi:hypothetical protein